jgi:hypothetical protein
MLKASLGTTTVIAIVTGIILVTGFTLNCRNLFWNHQLEPSAGAISH